MESQKILITGGCGFVGSSLALAFYEAGNADVIVLDNLYRKGSGLNLQRLQKHGIKFIRGDVRNLDDLMQIGPVDVLIECSAEPSVLAGYSDQRRYLLDTNLVGCINCLEYAAVYNAKFIFISTSRVYPIQTICGLPYEETATRFSLKHDACPSWCTANGFTEDVPIQGYRSLYGASKLSAELIIQEYVASKQIQAVINRCGVLTGPWQMGKEDQGFVALWVARHFWNKPLKYIGFNGSGKQVRDILHVDDLFELIKIQLELFEEINGEVFNIGGGRNCSVSLCELTQQCTDITRNQIPIESVPEERPGDLPIYLSDFSKAEKMLHWVPKKKVNDIIMDIHCWIKLYKNDLEDILNG